MIVSKVRRAIFAIAIASSATIAILPRSVIAGEPTTRPNAQFVEQVAASVDQILTDLSVKADEKDLQYYDQGVWHCPTDKVWACQGGPPSSAALLWRWRELHKASLTPELQARQTWLREVAIETVDHYIREGQNPDGSARDPGSHVSFFWEDVGLIYNQLKDTLDDETKQRWTHAIVSQIEAFQRDGNLPDPTKSNWKATDGWYVNGNVELAECELVYHAWKMSGDEKFRELFETQWKHTLAPSQARWKDYGMFYITEPTKEDGSDGAAYVAECEQEPGYDPAYTQLQLSIASRLYVQSGDPRVLRLANMEMNALLKRTDKTTWILDATYGSRHSSHDPFVNSGAMAALVWLGGRSDLSPFLVDEFDRKTKPFYMKHAAGSEGSPGAYRNYSSDFALILLAAEKAEGK